MTGVAMPDESRLPLGPQRDLTLAIHELYLRAGKPSTRLIQDLARKNDDLPGTVSRQWVSHILRGGRAKWIMVQCVVRVLAQLSVEPSDMPEAEARVHKLWLAADEPPRQPDVRETGPETLRSLVRGLYGSVSDELITWFLRTRLYLPQADNQGFLVASTTSHGMWICAFTSLERLRAHQLAVEPRWAGGMAEMAGRDLVRRVRTLGIPVGIVVDPAAEPDTETSETLPLPADLLAEIGDSL